MVLLKLAKRLGEYRTQDLEQIHINHIFKLGACKAPGILKSGPPISIPRTMSRSLVRHKEIQVRGKKKKKEIAKGQRDCVNPQMVLTFKCISFQISHGL